MYCTECIIGIIQNAGTPSRLRFIRTRRDEGRRERSQVNLSHDSSRARRAVSRACELPLDDEVPGGPQSFGAYIISQATGFLRYAAKL